MRQWIKQLFASSEKIGDTPNNAMTAGTVRQSLDQAGESAKYKALGDRHLHSGDFATAAHCYRQAIALDPDNTKALASLGFALKEQGLFDDAIQIATRALAIDSTIVDAQYLMGIVSQATGKPDAALTYFRKTLELDPNFEIVYRDLCFLLFQLGRLEEARQIAIQGTAQIPNSVDLHFYLGNLYHAERQFDLAIISFEQALLIQPQRAEILANLGLALLAKGDPAQAVIALQKALALNPNLIDARFNLGSALQTQNKTAEAIACYRAVLENNPQHIAAQNNLGSALRTIGNLNEALICYDHILANDPDSAEAYCNAGIVLTDLRRFDDAMSNLRRALDIKPDFVEAHSNLGTVLLALGQVDHDASLVRADR